MFGTIDVKCRPIRLAYLVDPHNAGQVRQAIQLSSTLWGGTSFPIIPLYQRIPKSWEPRFTVPAAESVIRGYLEAFDPDAIVQLSSSLPSYIADVGIKSVKADQVWHHHRSKESNTPLYGIGAFEILEGIFDEAFRYKPKFPMRVVVPTLPNKHGLFWASLLGEFHPDIGPELERQFSELLDITHVDASADQLTNLLKPDVIFPRRVAQFGLSPVNRGRRVYASARVFFMDAGSTSDIIDYWNLRAMGGEVLPLPKQLLEHPQMREVLYGFLRRHRAPWRHQPEVCNTATIVCSRSSTMEELKEFGKTVNLPIPEGGTSKDGFFSMQHWYPRVWDEWARGKDGAEPDDEFAEDEDSIEIDAESGRSVSFKALLPKFAEPYGVFSEGRCVNELELRIYRSSEQLAQAIPPTNGKNLKSALARLPGVHDEWRVGRNGLARIVRHTGTVRFDIPLSQDVMFGWLKDQGWEPQLSSAGILAKQIWAQLEGWTWFLASERLLGLLEYMSGGRARKSGQPVEADPPISGPERELPLNEIVQRLRSADTDDPRREVNELISKRIFRVGLRAKCPNCLRHSWFAMDALSEELGCPKCLRTFTSIGAVEHSGWRYKTTGPFSVPGYADGAYALLLALGFFDRHKFNTKVTPALSFNATAPDGRNIEADFGLFWSEMIYGEQHRGVVFGECKTYGHFKAIDFERMRLIAQAFPGAVLVFATLRKELTTKEKREITRIAKRGRKYWKAERPINPVLILTGNELFSYHEPPYCWSTEHQGRFRHLAGLLALCDATQQVYLDLPSWQTTWHEKGEARRRRMVARLAKTASLTPQQPN